MHLEQMVEDAATPGRPAGLSPSAQTHTHNFHSDFTGLTLETFPPASRTQTRVRGPD